MKINLFFKNTTPRLCVFLPHEGARSRKPAQVICIRSGRYFRTWMSGKTGGLRPSVCSSKCLPGERMGRAPENFDKPARGIVEGERLTRFAHHPIRGERARHDSLPDGRTGSRAGPTHITLGLHLYRSVTPVIFTRKKSKKCQEIYHLF